VQSAQVFFPNHNDSQLWKKAKGAADLPPAQTKHFSSCKPQYRTVGGINVPPLTPPHISMLETVACLCRQVGWTKFALIRESSPPHASTLKYGVGGGEHLFRLRSPIGLRLVSQPSLEGALTNCFQLCARSTW